MKMQENKVLQCHCQPDLCDGADYCEVSGDGWSCYYQQRKTSVGSLNVEKGCCKSDNCVFYGSAGSNYCCDSNFCNGFPPNSSTDIEIAIATSTATATTNASMNTWAIGVPICAAILLFAIICGIHKLVNRKRRRQVSDRPLVTPVYVGAATLPVADTPRVSLATRLPALRPPAPPMRQRTIAEETELETVIGEGAFGKVWLGRLLQDPVAVKVFRSNSKYYFQKEERIYTKVISMSAYDNILAYKGSGERINPETREQEYWLITKYCPLGSLYQYLEREPVETVDICIQFSFDICSGLSYLHHEISAFGGQTKKAIAHRDIKPRNIFLCQANGRVTCVIGDFGYAVCAKNESASNDQNSSHYEVEYADPDVRAEITQRTKVGTLQYMAPEVLDESIGRTDFEKFKASDVYSLGLVIWEIGLRTKVAGIAWESHEQPYEREVPFLTPASIKVAVCDQKKRPCIPPFWNRSQKMKHLAAIIRECWGSIPERRISALTAKFKVGNIMKNVADSAAVAAPSSGVAAVPLEM